MINDFCEFSSVSPLRPLLVGDAVSDGCVAGFSWSPPEQAERTTHLDDRLILSGDEPADAAPARAVPQTAENAVAQGVMPPCDLPESGRIEARSIGPSMPERADSLLDLPGAPWQPLVRPLLAAVHASGHRAWLAGGAVRDLIAGVPLEDVNDLDLTGTVPPGRFTDITRQTLRACRMSEHRTTVTPASLVCAVVPPGSTTRMIEYRGLNLGGFRFPIMGSSIAEDAGRRDFSFNALLYDVLGHRVLDGSGAGLDDLRAGPRFRPLITSTDPAEVALIVVRAAKFAHRWGISAVDPELAAWVAALPPGLCDSLPDADWDSLSRSYRKSVSASVASQLAFAANLPAPGRDLLERLIGEDR